MLRKKHSSKYLRKHGMNIREIAAELGVGYGTAWNWMRDPVIRKAVVKDLGLPVKPEVFAD